MGKSGIWEALAFFLGHTLSCTRIMLELIRPSGLRRVVREKKICAQIFPPIHQFRNNLFIRALFLWDRYMWLFIDLASPNVTETQEVTAFISSPFAPHVWCRELMLPNSPRFAFLCRPRTSGKIQRWKRSENPSCLLRNGNSISAFNSGEELFLALQFQSPGAAAVVRGRVCLCWHLCTHPSSLFRA